jgi:hypothetical protein
LPETHRSSSAARITDIFFLKSAPAVVVRATKIIQFFRLQCARGGHIPNSFEKAKINV